jgi:hypothetical protein
MNESYSNSKSSFVVADSTESHYSFEGNEHSIAAISARGIANSVPEKA